MTALRVSNKKRELILNSPNRNEILQVGPPRDAKCKVLGRGAFGTVFKATYKAQPVAVKVISQMKDKNFRTLENEGNIQGWKHPNVIQVIQVESMVKFGLVIMERFDGQCLQSVLDLIELPLVHRVQISLDILNALSYCHSRRVLHLDVKPQNVLVCLVSSPIEQSGGRSRRYVSKLCDFGASLRLEETQKRQAPSLKCSTNGTVRYMAPERLRQESVSEAADIYALGITMWQLKERHLPYYSIDSNETVTYQVVKHNLRPDSKIFSNSRSYHALANLTQNHGECYCEKLANCHTDHSMEAIKCALSNWENDKNEKALLLKENTMTAGKHVKRLVGKQILPYSVASSSSYKCNLRTKLNSHCVRAMHLTNGERKGKQLHDIFRTRRGQLSSPAAELEYAEIYRSCWHSDPSLRATEMQLRQRLESLSSNQR